MLPAIQFNCELAIDAVEIHDESSNWNLATEFVTAELSVAQARPDPLFRVGWFVPHHPSETSQPPVWISIRGHLIIPEKPSPYPLPEYRARGREGKDLRLIDRGRCRTSRCRRWCRRCGRGRR